MPSSKNSLQTASYPASGVANESKCEQTAAAVADLALEALLLEVTATPKPGLVDRRNCGAHKDMNFYTFINSALSLRHHFFLMALAGLRSRQEPLTALFKQVRQLGLVAEQEMFSATAGINTHKGALFSLGLLCAAGGHVLSLIKSHSYTLKGSDWPLTTDELGQTVALMAHGLCQRELSPLLQATQGSLTHGQNMFLRHGSTGARGQAEGGFREVRESYLPFLRSLRHQNLQPDEIYVRTLLKISANLEDTNILTRVGPQFAQDVQKRCAWLNEHYSQKAVQELDDYCIEHNISPGGAADLLSVTIFMDKICRQ